MRWRLAVLLCVAIALGTLLNGQNQANVDEPVFRGLNAKLRQSRYEAGGAQDVAVIASETAKALAGTWTVSRVEDDGTFRLDAPRTESTEVTTPAQAWELAHALRNDRRFDFEYVEPSFLVDGVPEEVVELEDCVAAPVLESGGDGSPIEGATKDSEWSLDKEHGANVLEAWKKFPAGTLPGAGVWVGHPDTGYRPHPEIYGMPDSPVHPALGWDFVANDPDPADVFEDGTLRWPGHGTRTSSVIVSPRGRQLPGGSARGISGVAPGARLIPLRVANGVVLFDQANLASAIRAAASPVDSRVKQQVDVISISLGGPPSRALSDAVQLAERNGVLVIAAAGNNVRKVVWPARYPQVIAMAASNYDGKVWDESSGGSTVAVGAPGESVWIASPKMQGSTALDCLSMSSGTSYATATTAGIAALWVARHRGTRPFNALKSTGQLTSVFRQILRSTTRSGTDWNTRKYGPGIVNAAAVLDAPLPAPGERAPALSPTPCDVDLSTAASLFEEVRAPRARVSELFGLRRGADVCAIAALADEVAFHYATSAGVANAIEAISGRRGPGSAALARVRAALRTVGSDRLKAALPVD